MAEMLGGVARLLSPNDDVAEPLLLLVVVLPVEVVPVEVVAVWAMAAKLTATVVPITRASFRKVTIVASLGASPGTSRFGIFSILSALSG
jgi:hypothetical protein